MTSYLPRTRDNQAADGEDRGFETIRKTPRRQFFWSQKSPKTRRFFSRVPDVTRSRRPDFFWLQTSPRDDSPRSQKSPQKSLSRLDVSKKKLEFFLRQKSQKKKNENCPPASFCRCFLKEIAMRNHMSAFSSKQHTNFTKKRYSLFWIRKIQKHFSEFVAKNLHNSRISSCIEHLSWTLN